MDEPNDDMKWNKYMIIWKQNDLINFDVLLALLSYDFHSYLYFEGRHFMEESIIFNSVGKKYFYFQKGRKIKVHIVFMYISFHEPFLKTRK